MNLPPPTFTLRALYHRARLHPWLKGLGTSGIMAVFFIAYFAVLNHPIAPVTVVPVTWIDGLIGFQPWTIAAYFSLWFYVSLPAALMVERRQLLSYGTGSVALAALGLTVFLFWPTTIIPPDIDWSLHPGLAFLKSTDSSGNAFPSLHVAFSVFAALWFVRLIPEFGGARLTQTLNALWAALIVHSTLGTHQHVALDALFGIALGSLVAALNFIACPTRSPHSGERPALWSAVLLIKISAVLLWTSGISLAYCTPLFFSAGALVLYHLFAPNAQGLVRVRSHFAPTTPDAREVWLTLDDGPDPANTPRTLDLLDQHHARVTFFLIGQRAAQHPALVAEISRRGHEIAHHTHTHPLANFWCASPTRVNHELDAALTSFASAGVPRPLRFRAPVGIKNLFLASALANRKLTYIGWTIRSGDTFAHDPAQVAARVARRLCPGAIILLHDGPPVRPELRVTALAAVLELLRAHDYRAVIPSPDQLR